MATVASLNAIARKRARRESEAAIAAAVLSGDVNVRKTMTLRVDGAGIVEVTAFNLDARTLLLSIDAQTAGVAPAARTITKNANTTLTIV